MKLPAWDNKRQRWDNYKAFHINHRSGFVQFDTGEVICTLGNTNRDVRGNISDLNVGVHSHTDKYCPDLYLPDGTRVPTAWLGTEGVDMITDPDTNRVVPFAYSWRTPKLVKHRPGVPNRFQDVSVYFAGEGREPIGNKLFKIMPPDRIALTPEEREHKDMIVSTAKALVAMTRDDLKGGPIRDTECAMKDILKARTAADLDDRQLQQIYKAGVARRVIEYSYLKLDPSRD